MLNITEPNPKISTGIALWQLGFRPFFLGAGSFSVISMMVWMGIYIFEWQLPLSNINPTIWHAHEMLFGYALAVIAGFLLAAVKNWTGQQTITGSKLIILFSIWASARFLPFLNIGSIEIIALLDCLFILLTAIAVAAPILKVKQRAQIGVLAILFLMFTANVFYYAGLLGFIENGDRIGIYSCFYLVLTMIFVMGRRVIPFFIERGVNIPVSLTNRKWLDISSLTLLVALWFVDVIYIQSKIAGALAGILFILHAIRLYDWHTKALWKASMLWVLYTAYAFLTLGFALKAASVWFDISVFISIHAFTVGGIGTLTLGMMSRVTLGHTGRNVQEPPRGLSIAFMLLLLGAVSRVILPLLLPELYRIWVATSQVLWIGGFVLFLILFIPMLIKPRIDGQPG
ncbi:MAG: NnrS family protein [Gammaproteobacteria bacterium]|nr:NnrS family protein [Gammaproteobacteria bacterium]